MATHQKSMKLLQKLIVFLTIDQKFIRFWGISNDIPRQNFGGIVNKVVRLFFLVFILSVFVHVPLLFAADSNLPGGTQISADIHTEPVINITVASPDAEVDVAIPYTAAIGMGTPLKETDVILGMDFSGSTLNNSCGTRNIYQCELDAAAALNSLAFSLGTIDKMAIIGFANGAVTADAQSAMGLQVFSDSEAEISQVINSIARDNSSKRIEFNEFTPVGVNWQDTEYSSAIQEIDTILASNSTQPNVIVLFISDGANTGGSDITTLLPSLPSNVTIHTFAVGDRDFDNDPATDNCNVTQFVSNSGAVFPTFGSLQQISNATNGTCTIVNDPTQLPNLLPTPIIPVLESIEFSLNGNATTIATPNLDGPASFPSETTATGLAVGSHQACIRAIGSDVGGSGDVQECVTINVIYQEPPILEASCEQPNEQFIDVIGSGVRSGLNSFSIADVASVQQIYVESTFKSEVNVAAPSTVMLQSTGETHTLSAPIFDDKGYVFSTYLQPASQASLNYVGPDSEPLSLVGYVSRENTDSQAQSMVFTNQFVEDGRHQLGLNVAPTSFDKDITVRFVVSDIDPDTRTVQLFARAGNVRERVEIVHPNMEDGLLIYDVVLRDVPGSVDEVLARVSSPANNGDSLFWNSVSASHHCEDRLPETERVTADLQMLYQFSEGSGSIVHDLSGNGAPLDLQITDDTAVTWLPTHGLQLHQNAQLISGDASAKWAAFLDSNEITIEYWGVVDNRQQDGPARIVSSSPSPTESNFTFGQDGPDFDFRLTTQQTTENGRPSLAAISQARPKLQHIVYTRDSAGVVRIYVDGKEWSVSLLGGDFSLWDTSFPLVIGNEATLDRPWSGELHLIGLYNRALTSVEIEQNYTAGAH